MNTETFLTHQKDQRCREAHRGTEHHAGITHAELADPLTPLIGGAFDLERIRRCGALIDDPGIGLADNLVRAHEHGGVFVLVPAETCHD